MTIHAERTPRPLRADAERNRHRILAAAREVFARRGLDAGLDEIARHAGVGTATVYRRFPDKSQLIEALFEDRLDQVLNHARRAVERPDPWEALTELLESVVEMQISDRGLKDVIFGQVGETDVFRERRGQIGPLLETVLQRARASGALRPDVGITDFASLQIMLTHVASFAGPDQPDVWRRYLRILLDGMRNDRSGPTPLVHPPLTFEAFEAACGRGR